MATASKLVLISVFILDIIAFGLAVAAEQRRSTAKVQTDKEREYTYCVYDSDISTGLGVGAFFVLLATQAIIMGVSRCLCCSKPLRPTGSRAFAVVFFILCWILFFIAEACLLAGASRNSYHTNYKGIAGVTTQDCEILRKGVFASGAAFVLLTAIVSEIYYICYSRARDGFESPYERETGVGMQSYK